MKFIADLHIHSKYSIATSKSLDFENLHIAAQLKGIRVIGTGDITHPQWFKEAREKLIPAEKGLYRLKDDLASVCDLEVPSICRAPVRFMLTAEISNIYKKNERTRKNHNLVFIPDLEAAARFNGRLDRIGNIRSDGRPILGLDARNLLEIVLETSEQAVLIPAHIWTPWFSVLGSKSGFDRISECFEDLTPHIFAVETGLSSDPEMNWRISDLDGLTLISNSDAHSPQKLGREANIFDTDLNYSSIISALKSGDKKKFKGTFEFYPQEGKYHMDGHRKCRICYKPSQTIAAGGCCPVCGKALTKGVLYRVEELSDRKNGEKPEITHPFYSIVPLTDILSEIVQCGPNSKKVQKNYRNALDVLGSEFSILHELSADQIARGPIALLADAVLRMRRNEIKIRPGYDGEFGKISIFGPDEREKLLGQKRLFTFVQAIEKETQNPEIRIDRKKKNLGKDIHKKKVKKKEVLINDGLNDQQVSAIRYSGGPLMIVAGPGTGKTLTLTHRIAFLIRQCGVSAENILAMTFTNKASEEMKKRLQYLLGFKEKLPYIGTFHAICFEILKKEVPEKKISVIEDIHRKALILDAIGILKNSGTGVTATAEKIIRWISDAKTRMEDPDAYREKISDKSNAKEFTQVYQIYQRMLSIEKCYDFDDLIGHVVTKLEQDRRFRESCRKRFKTVLVDEYQDLNRAQYRMIKALSSADEDICVIGDPDQAIYGFRGSDVRYFSRFKKDYPKASVVYLNRNYRSSETILRASECVIGQHSLLKREMNLRSDKNTHVRRKVYSGIDGVKTIGVIQTPSERSEAVSVGKIIEKMVGGTGFHTIDFGKIDGCDSSEPRNFSDFAVLFRTTEQIRIFEQCFEKAGIPCQVASRDKYYDGKDLSAIVSVLRIIEGYGHFIDLENVVRGISSGLGKKTLQLFKQWSYQRAIAFDESIGKVEKFPVPGMKSAQQSKLNALIQEIKKIRENTAGMDLKGKIAHIFEKMLFNGEPPEDAKTPPSIDRLISLAEAYPKDAVGFFKAISLRTDTDFYESTAQKVALMTIHAAKGLEFPVVFVAGCESGYIPFIGASDEKNEIDEERRLFFVAMTRAKERLYLTFSDNRSIYGKKTKRDLSPFVSEIEKNLIEKEQYDTIKSKKKRQKQLSLF